MGAMDTIPWSIEEFETRLRAKDKCYHIHHPFHIAMNGGKCTKEQVQGWVLNRFYYQIMIPIKDGSVLSNMPDREHRKLWIQRILDHDGVDDDEGGIEAWIALGKAVGLSRDDIVSLEHVTPGVKFAVDAYVSFARRSPWQESVCSSLTELFAPTIHKKRLDFYRITGSKLLQVGMQSSIDRNQMIDHPRQLNFRNGNRPPINA